MPPYRTLIVTCPVVLVLSVLSAAPALAAPAPDYEAPFPCAQEWYGSTRSSHSPSVYSVDFNRTDDMGDLTVATAPGVVTRVADTGNTSYGKYVIIDHGGGATSLYAHMLAQFVTTGQRVDQGTVLGLVGTSGGSTGSHLHFEQRAANRVQRPSFHQSDYVFNTTLSSRNCPDVPLAGNWDGRPGDELGVFRHGIGTGIFRLARSGMPATRVELGNSSDTPLAGDWDGDGRTDLGVRTAGSTSFRLQRGNGTTATVSFGRIRDLPVAGDWNGNGTSEIGVWRPDIARFRLRQSPGVFERINLGTTASLPLTGDWNGDDITDVGVFDPGTGQFTLRTRPAGGAARIRAVTFGGPRDLPVTGDWNGDGRTDVGVWSPSTGMASLNVPGAAGSSTTVTKRLGLPRVR